MSNGHGITLHSSTSRNSVESIVNSQHDRSSAHWSFKMSHPHGCRDCSLGKLESGRLLGFNRLPILISRDAVVDDIDDGPVLIDQTVSEDTISSATVCLDIFLDRAQ